MSPRDALIVVSPDGPAAVAMAPAGMVNPDRCLPQFAASAAKSARFPSSRDRGNRFIAAIAIPL
jgi:hypothetical protein